jgi:N-acetylmuramoyl-L-alanine amidase
MTAILCECAFIDNDRDNDIIDTVAEQKAFGVAYAKAILEYLGITYKEKVVATSTNKLYYVKVGAYRDKKNADAMVEKLKAKGFNAYITSSK